METIKLIWAEHKGKVIGVAVAIIAFIWWRKSRRHSAGASRKHKY